jgi:hypothetical protein
VDGAFFCLLLQHLRCQMRNAWLPSQSHCEVAADSWRRCADRGHHIASSAAVLGLRAGCSSGLPVSPRHRVAKTKARTLGPSPATGNSDCPNFKRVGAGQSRQHIGHSQINQRRDILFAPKGFHMTRDCESSARSGFRRWHGRAADLWTSGSDAAQIWSGANAETPRHEMAAGQCGIAWDQLPA